MTHINQRRDSAVNWSAANPVLQLGEVGWVMADGQPSKAKVGDGVTAWNSLPFSVDLQNLSGYAQLASPTFTGDPKAPTPATVDNDTSIATTAFVKAQGYLTSATAASTYAPVASPSFTGNPTAPTPLAGDNDTSIATTAFVKAQGYLTLADISGKADLASPVFTGNPTAPTPTAGDNDTSIATTAFVTSAVAGKANIDSPTFTGNPTAPTPATSDNDTSVATTAFVKAQGYQVASGLGTAAFVNTGVTVGTVALLNSSGRFDVARLGSGTPDGTKFLRDDGTFAVVPGGGGGGGGSGDVVGPGSSVSGNVPTFNGTSGKVLQDSGVAMSQLATLDSPTFIGTPAAPTPATSSNDTSVATTAFVKAQNYAPSSSLATIATSGSAMDLTATGTKDATTFLRGDDTWAVMEGITQAAADLRYVALNGAQTVYGLKTFDAGAEFDDLASFNNGLTVAGSSANFSGLAITGVGTPVNPTDAATRAYVDAAPFAPLASPSLTGNPTAPTPLTSDNDTSIATTAFVKAQGYLTSADLSTTYATIASPTFTGDPKAPTPATSDNDTSIATTAFVKAQGYATSTDIAGSYVTLSSAQTITGSKTFAQTLASTSGIQTALNVTPTISLSGTAGYNVLYVDATETTIGSGTNSLARFSIAGATRVRIDRNGGIYSTPAAPTDTVHASLPVGDTGYRFLVDGNGKHNWGPGNAGTDTNLYRSGAGALRTDGTFNAATALYEVGSRVFTENNSPRLGVGGYAQPAGNDWNNAVDTGWYSGSSAANAPVATGWVQVMVQQLASNTDYVLQTASSYVVGGATSFYQRVKNAGTWGPWQTFDTRATSDALYMQNQYGGLETQVNLSATSGTATANCALANTFRSIVTGNITLSMINVNTAYSATTKMQTYQISLYFNGAYTVTYPANTFHAGGAAVTPVANKWLRLTMQTEDNGAYWFCTGAVFG